MSSRDTQETRPVGHKRTRSQLQLTSCNIAFARSPLRDARDALRRANMQQKSALGHTTMDIEDSGRLGKGVDCDVRIEDVENHSDCEREEAAAEGASVCVDPDPSMENEIRSSPIKKGEDSREEPPSTTSPEFAQKAPPKRSRSPAFDEVFDSPSSRSRLSNDSTATKKPKFGSGNGVRGPLDAFFSRQGPSQLKPDGLGIVAQAAPSTPFKHDGGSRRVVSDGQGLLIATSSRTQSASTAALPVPPTPTIKQLKAIPVLDLHALTPSPRKKSVDINVTKSPATGLRAVSKGNILRLQRAEDMAGLRDTKSGVDHGKDTGAALPSAASPLDGQHSLKLGPNDIRENPFSSLTAEVHLADASVPLELEQKRTDEASSDIAQQSRHRTPSHDRTSGDFFREVQTNHQIDEDIGTEAKSLRQPVSPLKTDNRSPLRDGHADGKFRITTIFTLSPLSRGKGKQKPGTPDDAYEEEEKALENIEQFDEKVADAENVSGSTAHSTEARPSNMASTLDVSQDGVRDMTASLQSVHSPPSFKPELLAAPKTPVAKDVLSATKAKSTASKTARSSITKRSKILPTTTATPRMRLTRAAILRQKQQQERHKSGISSPVAAKIGKGKERAPEKISTESKAESLASTSASEARASCVQDEKERSADTKKAPRKSIFSLGPAKSETTAKPSVENSDNRKERKRFTLTLPSSLSPAKRGANSNSNSAASSANSSFSLPSKPFTFSLYPPSINDPEMKARSQHTLSSLSSALDKLTMPPPPKPESRNSEGTELRRPSTSLGFTRELSVPASARQELGARPRPLSRAGSIEPSRRPTSFMPPPPPPRFDLDNKGKAKASLSVLGIAPERGPLMGSNRARTGFKPVGIFGGRAVPRFKASQKTSLDTVQGSPVKGDAPVANGDGDESNPGNLSVSSQDSLQGRTTPTPDRSIEEISSTDSKGRKLVGITKLNGSRRASMVFSALAQALNTPESGPDGDVGASAENQASPLASSAQNDASTPEQEQVTPAGNDRLTRTASLRSRHTRSVSDASPRMPSSSIISESEGEGKSNKKSATGRSKMPGSLDVLSQCTVFVDVRSEEGEDAGALFVDMLRNLGAKVLTRIGQSCTHIVYKNGLPSTLSRYRLLDEPRPSVVGIGWVVACAEKRELVDIDRFKVNVDNINVAGTLKRRKSFLPKPMHAAAAGPMDAFINGFATAGPPKAVLNSDEPTDDEGEASPENNSNNSNNLKSSLNYNPLEQARRRRSLLPRVLGT